MILQRRPERALQQGRGAPEPGQRLLQAARAGVQRRAGVRRPVPAQLAVQRPGHAQ